MSTLKMLEDQFKIVEDLSMQLGEMRAERDLAEAGLVLSNSKLARLQDVIEWAVRELDSGEPCADLSERMINESVGLVQCSCGKLHAQLDLVWRAWREMGVDLAECSCGSTLSRVPAGVL